ncbi:hypothetical protein QA648_36350 (plasmid) [Rhizobium sp. CB3171]|uniref:hypothetical protein n=1 Tax=Rhizobium sp. CB3171 TaxID=3039157 RepID=UPI0024B1DFEB|nr:hypothetical protein [Rhizobium sp. CB3171]WFU07485.1 hypothetical protein QA648_36350 [Rhizobium sp. CB3171]
MTDVFEDDALDDMAKAIDTKVDVLIARMAGKMIPNEESFSEKLLGAIRDGCERV